MLKVHPSILGADHGVLADEARRVTAAGADYLHMDVMDGIFVPNFGVGTGVFKAVSAASHLPLDAHLMIVEPARYIEKFRSLGAEIITIHTDSCKETGPMETLNLIRESGAAPGIAINPDTPIEAIAEFFPYIEYVLAMTVQPGFGGQKFIESTLPKLARLGELARSHGFSLCVDGNITDESAIQLAPLGVTNFVIGTGIFRNEHTDAKEIIDRIHNWKGGN